MQPEDLAAVPPFLVRHKELIAAIGIALGVVPRLLDTMAQFSRRQTQHRELTLERENLELTKLRHEIEKIRRELGEPAMPISASASWASIGLPDTFPGAPLPDPPAARQAIQPSSAAVEWLSHYPWAATPLLWCLQVALGCLAVLSAIVTVGFPVAMVDPEVRADMGWGGALAAEAIYVLMTWAFVVMYRKARNWRRSVPSRA